jgi:hypothetical protein
MNWSDLIDHPKKHPRLVVEAKAKMEVLKPKEAYPWSGFSRPQMVIRKTSKN